MTGSYIGGGVNFIAIKDSYQVSENLTNPLLVADNFIMAGMILKLERAIPMSSASTGPLT